MDRKEFIKTCGFACLGGAALMAMLDSCASASKLADGEIKETDLVVPVKDFQLRKGGFKQYLIVQHEMLQYPVCVYRFNENEYVALWMSCSHQGAELQVFGDKLQCPAHGSEFDNKGQVAAGPAVNNLRRFPLVVDGGEIKISLKA